MSAAVGETLRGRQAADPRVRARRVAVAREAGRRRLRVASAVSSTVALAVTVLLVLHSSLFAARVFHVEGAVHETRAEILSVTGLGRHPPLVDVSAAAAAAALERLPWVASARVVVDWPTGVSVSIKERRPVAYIPLPRRRAALVDASGRILTAAGPVPLGLVALAGPISVGPPGTRLGHALGELAVAAKLPPSLEHRVAAVVSSSSGGVELRLVDGPVVVLGSASDLGAKVGALSTVLAEVPLRGVSVVNVSVPAQPVLTR